MLRIAGLAGATAYAALIVWMYVNQPQDVPQLTGGLAATIGAYQIDRQAFDDGVSFFHRDAFLEARAAFARADPARRDPLVQFYAAYSFYREGWGRLYNDEALFGQGLEAVDRAIELAPGHRLIVPDESLGMHSADELRAELQRGLGASGSTFNPMRVFGRRK